MNARVEAAYAQARAWTPEQRADLLAMIPPHVRLNDRESWLATVALRSSPRQPGDDRPRLSPREAAAQLILWAQVMAERHGKPPKITPDRLENDA